MSPVYDALVFILVVTGLAAPLLIKLTATSPVTRLAIAIGGALVILYLSALFIYLSGIPWITIVLAPLLGSALSWKRRTVLVDFFKNESVRQVVIGWLLIATYGVSLQTVVVSYSGGGWAGDWYEHYERARFFLQHWPDNYLFLGISTLPARPPLTNLITAAFLGLTGNTFSNYQVFMTLISTLVVFPLAVFAVSFSLGVRWLVCLLMINPLFVHNAVYPWTKLSAAYFIVLGTALIWKSSEDQRLLRWAPVALAAGIVCHYSAVPWAIALGLATAWSLRKKIREPSIISELRIGVVIGIGLLSSWFSWSILKYGVFTTVHATSTVGLAPESDWLGHLRIAWENILHTISPDFDSPILAALMQQPHIASRMRDFWFSLYQQNLPAAFGLGNLCILGWLIAKQRISNLAFWSILVVVGVILGVTAHTWPVDLGLTHICLQALVLLGLVWVSGHLVELPRIIFIAWIAGSIVDFLLGIVLHFGIQSLAFPRLFEPGNSDSALVWYFSGAVMTNYNAKQQLAQPFLVDLVNPAIAWALAGLSLGTAFILTGFSPPGKNGALSK